MLLQGFFWTVYWLFCGFRYWVLIRCWLRLLIYWLVCLLTLLWISFGRLNERMNLFSMYIMGVDRVGCGVSGIMIMKKYHLLKGYYNLFWIRIECFLCELTENFKNLLTYMIKTDRMGFKGQALFYTKTVLHFQESATEWVLLRMEYWSPCVVLQTSSK